MVKSVISKLQFFHRELALRRLKMDDYLGLISIRKNGRDAYHSPCIELVSNVRRSGESYYRVLRNRNSGLLISACAYSAHGRVNGCSNLVYRILFKFYKFFLNSRLNSTRAYLLDAGNRAAGLLASFRHRAGIIRRLEDGLMSRNYIYHSNCYLGILMPSRGR
jgi:hypothetical protein